MVLAREYWLPAYQLSKNASNGPQINSFIVLAFTENHLWCPVPPCDHIHRQLLLKGLVLLNERGQGRI